MLYCLRSSILEVASRSEARGETPDSTLEKAESLVESYQASQRFENRAREGHARAW